MRKPFITKKLFRHELQVLHWVSREQLEILFSGKTGRKKRIETLLARLPHDQKQPIARLRLGRRWIYSTARKAKRSLHKIEHGLGCSDVYIRLRVSLEGRGVAEKQFYKFPIVPDFGILYPHEVLLMGEYCSKDNFNRKDRIRRKIELYQNNMWSMAGRYGAKPVVLFVIKTDRMRVRDFVLNNKCPIWFCDWESFMKIPLGKAFTTPIYIWGEDGKEECL